MIVRFIECLAMGQLQTKSTMIKSWRNRILRWFSKTVGLWVWKLECPWFACEPIRRRHTARDYLRNGIGASTSFSHSAYFALSFCSRAGCSSMRFSDSDGSLTTSKRNSSCSVLRYFQSPSRIAFCWFRCDTRQKKVRFHVRFRIFQQRNKIHAIEWNCRRKLHTSDGQNGRRPIHMNDGLRGNNTSFNSPWKNRNGWNANSTFPQFELAPFKNPMSEYFSPPLSLVKTISVLVSRRCSLSVLRMLPTAESRFSTICR